MIITNPVDLQVVKAGLMPVGAVVPAASNLAELAQGLNRLLRHFGMAIFTHPCSTLDLYLL